MSQTTTGNVRKSTGHASKGDIDNVDSAPAPSAMAARFHPQDRMIERPAARNLSDIITAGRLRQQVAERCCHWPEAGLRRERPHGGCAGCEVPAAPFAWQCAIVS